eukprot:gnl/MRDRNA2_/MRDRNA2_17500_c0_seq1.p1 gnl/MRDRNA2_/MRDRNA2_17500_c0~~gnl/MRDRNA2_/MRDRNA2_17500_c0_seq1.p1  ORF type:complete len:310 (+),score=46.83 gnl/MRDRNA2_/MRDRNA2_17500_c0_seq1:57-932(+)
MATDLMSVEILEPCTSATWLRKSSSLAGSVITVQRKGWPASFRFKIGMLSKDAIQRLDNSEITSPFSALRSPSSCRPTLSSITLARSPSEEWNSIVLKNASEDPSDILHHAPVEESSIFGGYHCSAGNLLVSTSCARCSNCEIMSHAGESWTDASSYFENDEERGDLLAPVVVNLQTEKLLLSGECQETNGAFMENHVDQLVDQTERSIPNANHYVNCADTEDEGGFPMQVTVEIVKAKDIGLPTPWELSNCIKDISTAVTERAMEVKKGSSPQQQAQSCESGHQKILVCL